jgi:molybdopterin/thiamine biosynthesis adenylyltransferase/rhodanese-related sulfurtransferase
VLTDLQKARFSRHFSLPGFTVDTQLRLARSRVLVVGAGGLGCPALAYLAASGVGSIAIMDGDEVEVSNLQRQVLFSPEDIGKNKANVAAGRLRMFNADINAQAIEANLGPNTAPDPGEFDLVVDGTDNFPTKYFIDDWTASAGLPWIFGSIFQFYGQVAALNVDLGGRRSARLRDAFSQPPPANRVRNCSEAGIVGAFAGVVGCFQAVEAVKVLGGLPGVLAGRMLSIDAINHRYEYWEFDGNRDAEGMSVFAQDQAYQVGLSQCEPADYEVTWSEALSLLASDGTTLVDVRSLDERHRSAPVEQSLHVPLVRLQDELERIASMARVVFYCASGSRSRKAAEFVRSRCPAVAALSIRGGMESYHASSSPRQ